MNSDKLAFSFIWKAAFRALIDPTPSIALLDLYFPEEVSWLGSSVQFYIACNILLLLWHTNHDLPLFNTPVSPVRSCLSADAGVLAVPQLSLSILCSYERSSWFSLSLTLECFVHKDSHRFCGVYVQAAVLAHYLPQVWLSTQQRCGEPPHSTAPAALSGFPAWLRRKENSIRQQLRSVSLTHFT